MAGWLDKYQEGGEVFLQPNSKKLPKGYKVPLKDESSELAMSIGGEQGEPAYLIPSFKYGKPLLNPLEEYRETGEHLGGPFKTWQEADKWEREIRHPYVEKGQPIPSPLKYWGEGFKNGGIVAQGGETIPLSREDYLRQQYQDYLKSQAEKGRNPFYLVQNNPIVGLKNGGIIPKAQEGKKVKKSVIFAESPKIEGGQPQYEIYDYHSQLPPSLNNLREKYKDLRKRADELYSTTESHRNYLINYLKGYTGKNVYSVNSDNTYYARDDDGYGSTYSTEEFKDLPPLKKYNELQKELDENYYPSLIALENEFRDHPDNFTTGDRVSDVFQVEGNKLREWYKKKGEELSVIPIYGIQDTSKVNAALKDVDLQDVGIMGHSGEILGGIPLEWWNDKLKDTEYRNCVLGSCYGDNLLPLLPDVKNIYHTIKNRWYGVNPSADSLENALFSTHEETKIKPIKGKDYNISNKYKTGGNVSYTPEYIEQLKRFENRPDNLAYHLDNKKIPTIGWGHKITEEELKRKAIKMGKEWVPYERFSGKEGRILADKLMEQDVSHHYARLERQVGKDTLSTLPPEVQDVLLDITYNRGSLGDSLEYVKKGDIAGLRDYLAETSKGLKGGAKTRMEWRANRIPLKTLPPVERSIEYNTKDQYVPEVLRSIAEQPSTQSIIPIQDNEGYRNQENYGKPVQITSNQSTTPISMQDVPFPILAMSDTGELKIMMPGEEHEFEGGSVTELPMAQQGDIIKSNQLRTFTKDIGWLSKYKES